MRVGEALRSGHPPTLFSAFLYFDVSFMIWVILGALGVYIARDFGLTATEKGLMVALPVLGGALLRVPMGVLADRIGAKPAGLLGMGATLAPLVWGWLFASSLAHVLALGLLLGVAGASFAVALPLASRWYPKEHQGLAMGIAGAGNSGTVMAALFAPRLAEAVGWHAVMGLLILPLVATMAVFARWARESPARPVPKRLVDYAALLAERDALWFCLLYGITFGGFIGLSSFLVIFFHDQYGLATVAAGGFTALCVFAGSFFRPVGGYLADRLGGVRMLTVLLGAVGFAMAGAATLPPLPVAILLLFLGMMGLGMGNGSVFQIVPQRFRAEIGVVTGVVGAAGGVGGFLLPFLLGYLKDSTGSYSTGLAGFSAAALGGLAALQWVNRRWSADWLSGSIPSALAPSGRVRMEVVFGG
jgi:NNP family nitrate/nitrite transporter-like MFS transporter